VKIYKARNDGDNRPPSRKTAKFWGIRKPEDGYDKRYFSK